MAQQLEDREIVIERTAAGDGVRIEPSPRWVRAYFAGTCVADSKHALLVFEPRRLPVYYFPMRDVRMDVLQPSDYSASNAGTESNRARWTLVHAGHTVSNAAWSVAEPDAARAL